MTGRVGAHQRPRVRVQGIFEDALHLPRLDNAARIEHEEVITELGDDTQVMSDIENPGLPLIAKGPDQIDDLRFQGDVQGGGRFIGYQQRRI